MKKPLKKLVALFLVVSLAILSIPMTSSALSDGPVSYDPAESNIAVKYWVTPSAASGDASLATDGNLETVWKPSSLPATLTLNLGGSYNAVRKVETVFADSNAVYKYILEGTVDGNAWTVLADRSANTKKGAISQDIFSLVDLCAIRITVLSGAAGISEFKVINYLREDMDNGSDSSIVSWSNSYYYNAGNNPAVTDIRGGQLTESTKTTGNNFFGLTKDLGWDTTRLRVWNAPKSEGSTSITAALSAYPSDITTATSCSPAAQRAYAEYIVGAGQNLAIDFHYSDSWSDPQNQPKPYAWANLEFDELVQATYDYTYDFIKSLIQQNTVPSIVALGNEITNGMMWGSEYLDVNEYADYHDYYRRFIRDNSLENLNSDNTAIDGRKINPDAKPGGGVKWVKYEEANGDTTSPGYQEFLESVENLSKLVDAGNRAIAALNAEYNLDIKSEMHFAFNVFEQPRNSNKVVKDPEAVFEKVTTLVGNLADNLDNMGGMVDRIGVSYYPDWHGTYAQVQRNIVELSKMLPDVDFNIAECSPKRTGSVSNWMDNPNYPVGTTFNTQMQGDVGIDIMKTINDVPNNVGKGVWPWNGQSVYGTGSGANATLYASFLSWNDAFAKNVLENNLDVVMSPGQSLNLPATVKSLDVATKTVSDVPVVWESIDPALLREFGTYTVNGVATVTVPGEVRGKAMTKVTATINVVEASPDMTFTVQGGKTITVPITLKDCTDFAGLRARLVYDESILTLESVMAKKDFWLANQNGALIALTPDGMGMNGEVVVGYAVFSTNANLDDDTTTYVVFDDVTILNSAQAPVVQGIEPIAVNVLSELKLRGDVNLDGKVDLADAILLLQYLSKNAELRPKQLRAADVTGDGDVNTADVIVIMQMCLD